MYASFHAVDCNHYPYNNHPRLILARTKSFKHVITETEHRNIMGTFGTGRYPQEISNEFREIHKYILIHLEGAEFNDSMIFDSVFRSLFFTIHTCTSMFIHSQCKAIIAITFIRTNFVHTNLIASTIVFVTLVNICEEKTFILKEQWRIQDCSKCYQSKIKKYLICVTVAFDCVGWRDPIKAEVGVHFEGSLSKSMESGQIDKFRGKVYSKEYL